MGGGAEADDIDRHLAAPNQSTPLKKKTPMDRMNALPDEVLIRILSYLPLKEAGRSSILSHRWRYMWTYLPSLDFNDPEMICYLYDCIDCDQEEAVKPQTSKYAQWVNQVIRAYQAPTIDSFRVQFFLRNNISRDIDSWVKFAVERGVRNLELNCLDDYLDNPLYIFPKMQPCLIPRIKLLKSLHLREVIITNEQLGFLLSECMSLEKIVIYYSRGFTRINTKVPIVQLKCLHIGACADLTSIMLSAPTPNLISFRFHGRISSFRIDYAPKLVDLFLGNTYFMSPIFHPLQRDYFSQLHTLIIGVYPQCDHQWDVVLPRLGQLKSLTLSVGRFYVGQDILSSLLAAAPCIQNFTLQVENQSEESGVLVPKGTSFYLQHLEVVEFRGFEWRKSYIDIALYMVSIAGSFKKLIIDTWEGSIMYVGDPNKREWWVKGEEEERFEQVKKQALVLGQELPLGGELVII